MLSIQTYRQQMFIALLLCFSFLYEILPQNPPFFHHELTITLTMHVLYAVVLRYHFVGKTTVPILLLN